MKYRHYSNSGHFFLLGLLFFVFFGGLRFFFVLLPLLFAIFFNLLPLFFLYFIFRRIFKNVRLSAVASGGSLDRRRFVELLIRILLHVVKADGKVDPREIQAIEQFFSINMGYRGAQMMWVKDLIDTSLKTPIAFVEVCEEFNRSMSIDAKRLLLQMVYRVCFSDGHFSREERDVVDEIVSRLGIDAADHERIRSMFMSASDSVDHYAVLGLKKGASKAEIKSAYKRLSKEYHPDKVHHLGEEFRKEAEVKMRQLNASYDFLSQEVKS